MNERLPNFKDKILLKKITDATEGLVYISETDAAVKPFAARRLHIHDIREAIELEAGDRSIAEFSVREFFSRLTTVRDHFGPVENERARRFAELETLLRHNLRDLSGFRVGRIQVDLFIVGLDREENVIGITTKAVET